MHGTPELPPHCFGQVSVESVSHLRGNRQCHSEAERGQAVSLGLIDRVGYVPDALEIARRAIGVDEARVIVYRRPRQYRATYYAQSETQAGGIESSLAPLASLLGGGPRFLYLWWP